MCAARAWLCIAGLLYYEKFIENTYLSQGTIVTPSGRLALILVARRSACYAGTRYLKRGANIAGNAANDVETEQIVWDVNTSPNFVTGRFTAHVQRRGSVPLRWSQDLAKRAVTGKPPSIQVR